jgi:hypothetical protein
MLAEPEQPDLEFLKQNMVTGTWGSSICEIAGLKELILEFETDEKKKAQLDVVVERAKHWKFPLSNENIALAWTGKLHESSWIGVKDLKDDYNQHLRASPVPENVPKRTYCVTKMIWRPAHGENETQNAKS